MKEAKTIVSINKGASGPCITDVHAHADSRAADPECPMAEIADFALVANLEDAVPELLCVPAELVTPDCVTNTLRPQREAQVGLDCIAWHGVEHQRWNRRVIRSYS
jgi:hypothetical protein